jgi:hypothetical protein
MAGTPSEVALRAWLDGLLGALAELHSVGWVHAAVSPGNILMLPGDRPMLLDSDAVHAALISDRTRSMMSELEPCFAPIEQRERASGSPVGPWTDLYSLAATIHFCISGHLPATPASRAVAPLEPLSALWRHLHAGQSRPSHEPSWLRALDACLAESAQDRPQSVAQLRASLDEQHACWLLVSEDMPGQRTTKHSAALGATEQEQTGQDAARAKGLLGLEQTLPFIAARAHEFVAVGHARALSAETAWPLARHRRRPWIGGVVLLLVVAATTGDWVGGGGSSSLAVSTGFASGVANASVQPAPVHAGTEALVILAPAAAMPDSSANAAQVAAAAESPSAANRGTTLTTMATTSQSGSRAPDNPRGLCGTRSGYALYQCMQIQCAKRDWTKHAQCQRLRQHQTLG